MQCLGFSGEVKLIDDIILTMEWVMIRKSSNSISQSVRIGLFTTILHSIAFLILHFVNEYLKFIIDIVC